MAERQWNAKRQAVGKFARNQSFGIIGNGTRPWFICLVSLVFPNVGKRWDTRYKIRLDTVIRAMTRRMSHML